MEDLIPLDRTNSGFFDNKYSSAHPGIRDFWMELSAVSIQHSAKDLFFRVLADSRQLMADRAHRKTAVFGWAQVQQSSHLQH
jgi:hypothetical protein